MTHEGSLSTLVSLNATNGSLASTLVQGSDGNLYGTTYYGVAADSRRTPACNCGTVFRLSREGTLTTLLSFNGANGSYPADLFEGMDRNFYGVTQAGGTGDSGTIFKMTPDGALTTLFSLSKVGFYSLTLGANLFQAIDGNLYGITGSSGGGVIFRLVQPPVLNVKAQPGGNVTLTWNSFAGGTYRVEYKPTLTDVDWTTLNPEVTATGSTTSLTDASASVNERYYRVRLLP
jgi:uncharacterized repeat protein (TIGR03803 family)